VSKEYPFYIFDSFAILAFLEGEEGAKRVQAVLEAARQEKAKVAFSVINLGEVMYIVERERGLAAAQKVLAIIEQLPLEILPATQERILSAAHIKARFRVAYADAFAIAAAQEFGGVALTGDPEFVEVEKIIQVEWLPRKK